MHLCSPTSNPALLALLSISWCPLIFNVIYGSCQTAQRDLLVMPWVPSQTARMLRLSVQPRTAMQWHVCRWLENAGCCSPDKTYKRCPDSKVLAPPVMSLLPCSGPGPPPVQSRQAARTSLSAAPASCRTGNSLHEAGLNLSQEGTEQWALKNICSLASRTKALHPGCQLQPNMRPAICTLCRSWAHGVLLMQTTRINSLPVS